MKVLHLLTSNSFSGAENVVCQIIKALKKEKGVEQVYCSPNGPIRETLLEKGVPYLPMKDMTRKNIRQAIDSFNPDIIHAHGTTAAVNAAMVCGKIPLVYHIHNNSFNSRRLSKKSIANLIPFIKASHVIWVTQHCLDCYKFSKIVKRKSTVVNNGVDLTVYQNANKTVDIDKLIMVSRFAPAKDHETVIKAMPLINSRFHLYFVGDGERRPLCETLVKELGLENRVHFLGARFDIPQLIANAFIGIQSSHWEGFGMSAVEIMACGIPVIASDADGLKQVVEGAGMIFKTGNEADLASKIQQLTTDDALYSRISKACLARSKEYSIDKTASKCLNIYKSILGTKANRTENLK